MAQRAIDQKPYFLNLGREGIGGVAIRTLYKQANAPIYKGVVLDGFRKD